MTQNSDQYEMVDADKRPLDVGGVESMPITSAHPTGAYRDIPIVWLTGSLMVQMIIMVTIYLLFSTAGPIIMAAFSTLTAISMWLWNEKRGMARAGTGWRVFSGVAICFIALLWALPALTVIG